MVLARVIVPSQAKVTVPPPAIAARKLASAQVVTMPAAGTGPGVASNHAASVYTGIADVAEYRLRPPNRGRLGGFIKFPFRNPNPSSEGWVMQPVAIKY